MLDLARSGIRTWCIAFIALVAASVLVARASAVLSTDTITTIVGGGETLVDGRSEFEGAEAKLARGGPLASNGSLVYFISDKLVTNSAAGGPGHAGVVAYVNPATGNGGPVTDTQPGGRFLIGPKGLAVGPGGDVLLADGSQIVRYSKTAAGTTWSGARVAGLASQSGFSGDGGAATSAKLSAPSALAVNASGRLYIADTGNNRVRYVEDGIIDAFAGTGTSGNSGDGGFAQNARLKEIRALALDKAGNLYIASGDRIRKVAAATGKISTIVTLSSAEITESACGNGAVELTGLVVDGVGNIYVSDHYRRQVWKIVAGQRSALAGRTCEDGFSGDGGEAGDARLVAPAGLAIDQQGSLYIMDTDNQRLRRVRNIPPQAGFALSPNRTTGNAPFTVTFTPTGSYDSNGAIIKFGWSFGGPAAVSTVKRAPVSRTFNSPGTYGVTLTVTDDSGATATASRTLTVH